MSTATPTSDRGTRPRCAVNAERDARGVDRGCEEAPLRLDSNEMRGLRAPSFDALSGIDPGAYPDATTLRARLAAIAGAAPERVLPTAGGDEALDRFIRLVGREGDAIVAPVPCFGMIPRFAATARVGFEPITWGDGPLPVDQLVETTIDAGALVLTTPDNPTARTIDVSTLVEIARRLADATRPRTGRAPRLLVDLAYVDFVTTDPSEALRPFPNVSLLRTLSKGWALASLRVGWLEADPIEIERLRAVGGPYTIASPSIALALAALDDDARNTDRDARIARVAAERPRLANTLRRLGVTTDDGEANFVCARFDGESVLEARRVRAMLGSLGVIVRGFERDDPSGTPVDRLRITLPGESAAFNRLERALEVTCAPEALLLDMDGVLVDVGESYRRAIVETCRVFGVEIDASDVQRAKRRPGATNDWIVTRNLLRERDVEAELDDVTRVFESIYSGGPEDARERIARNGPPLEMRERALVDPTTLSAWRERFGRVAIVTGRPRAQAQRALARFGLAPFVDALVAMEDAPGKPDPAPVRLALDSIDVERAWMLGDSPDDALAARAAGVVPIGVLAPGGGEPERTALRAAGAAFVLDRTTDLTGLLP